MAANRLRDAVTTETLISAGSGLLANRRLLSDVQSIEIVKGPQSALFGRAAFAGALSYTTKEPTSGENCGGQVRVLASIEDPGVIGKILAHREARRPVLAGEAWRPEPRGPPEGGLDPG